jgi:acyl-CoA synthetase (AMP-forming)/AMP-acid ligase II
MREGGWFNTEDLGRLDADGHLHIEGRTKDLIIVGGFNVYPLEVENALNAHPAVVHSAVVGRPDAGSEAVIAFVELAQGAQASLAAFRDFLATRLSPYKRPREIYVMQAIPVSPNGKVLKQRLRQLAVGEGTPEACTRLV